MQFFRVYQHKSKGYYAAPVGFNIQAALFSFLWAAANNLWGKAVLLFMFAVAMGAIIIFGLESNMDIIAYAGMGGLSLLPIWAGISGNEWIFQSLESQGFRLVRKIRAIDANGAIIAARKGGSSLSGGKRTGSKRTDARGKKKSEEDLPINAEPEWRRRRNNRMIK